MTAISGMKLSGLLKNREPIGLLVKTLLESSAWRSTMCLLIWKTQVTPRKRLLYRLAVLERNINGIEFGLLGTPRAGDFYRSRFSIEQTMKSTYRGEIGSFRRTLYMKYKIDQTPENTEKAMGFPPGWTSLEKDLMPDSPRTMWMNFD